MANLTYHATVTAPANISLYTTDIQQITGTIANPAGGSPASINFTLVSDVTSGTSTAILNAVFASPSWGVSENIENVQATFVVWPGGKPPPITSPMPAIALTTGTALPETSGSTSVTIGIPTSSASSTSTETSASGISSGPSLNPTTASPTPPPQPDHGYGTGALAGAAVGCLIAGLLVAGLIAFFLFRRRSKLRNHMSESGKVSSTQGLHGESLLVDAGASKAWEKQLPQPDSDKTIGQLASRTLDEIEMFVEEFYSDKPTLPPGFEVAQELSMFNSPHLSRPLADLLRTASTPTALVKHCIAFFLLRKIDPSSNDTQSLLPREYITPSIPQNPQQVSRQALSQLRVLMAHTAPDPDQDAQYLARREQTISNSVRLIEQAFRPWARGDASKRASALNGIMIHVSELGIKLFSQPASFRWQWEQSSSRAAPNAASRNTDSIAMLPGLDKVTDQKAELLASPICLVKPRRGNWALS